MKSASRAILLAAALGLCAGAAHATEAEFGGECVMGLALGKDIKTDCSVITVYNGKTYCFGNETAKSLESIVEGVEKAAALVDGIASASNEQATAVSQVSRGIEQVAQVVQTTSATAEESAATSEELSSQAELLKEMVGKFRLRVATQQKEPAKQAARSLPEGKADNKLKITLNEGGFGKY
jgi:hypothetical protein